MVDWQERITQTTPPAIRTEHDVRYRLAAPLIADAGAWMDLGCGNGIAAADAVGPLRPERTILVDVDEPAVEAAKEHLGEPAALALTGDLTSEDDLARLRAALLEAPGEKVVTCFEVVEHLSTFVPLLGLLTDLADTEGVTVVLSVPNDAFSGVENPHHQAVWGEGAVAELRTLLPESAVFVSQVELRGSAAVADGESLDATVPVSVRSDGAIPTHFIAAFGPRAESLQPVAAVAQTDLAAQRAWERQRESDAELVGELQKVVDELREVVERQSNEFADWRRYIHELETKLGMPPSGTPEREAWAAEQAAAGGS